MHLTLHTATESEIRSFLFDVKIMRINKNTQQFLSQMDFEMSQKCNTMKHDLKIASQKHV